MTNIRNVAIIAHVDHGKTTLVDALLRQSHTELSKDVADNECILDSNELERERGITIFSKNAAVIWGDYKINIIDTPGHADFGGEVERVLKMADGCLLLIDAKEGPMPQTRFVLRKALEMKLKVIVVINKIDRADAKIADVLNKTFDLFIELGADEESAYFPTMYASGKLGKAGEEPDLSKMSNIDPLFEKIIKEIPEPSGDENAPLQMLITTISGDQFKGRIATGRICNGILRAKRQVAHITREGVVKKVSLSSVMSFKGLDKIETTEAVTGDIVALAGVPNITIGETIADADNPVALPLLAIEEPTVKMTFGVNTSPFAGREGTYCTSRQLRERLFKELETDVALRVEEINAGNWIVSGRGELHLSIFIERLRREGYELQVSQPEAIVKEVNGQKLIPFEELYIEVPEQYQGAIMQSLGGRHAQMRNMYIHENLVFLEYIIPTRGLFGFRNEMATLTKGMGIMNSLFYEFQPDPGNWKERERGSLVAHETGVTNIYGLTQAQERGELFFSPGFDVYQGQVVGQNSRGGDLRINVCKGKHLTNVRSKGDGVGEHFKTPRNMSLEESIEYLGEDELLEVTPENIRVRKMILDPVADKRSRMNLSHQ
jgi:GTP-binding protein